MTSPTMENAERISLLTGAGSWGSSPRTNRSRRRLTFKVDARPVIARLRQLRAAGMTYSQMAEQSGLSITTVQRLVHRHPAHCSARTAMAVARLHPNRDDDQHCGLLVDAIGTRRRIGDLMLRGWSLPAIAEEANVSRGALVRALRADTDTVTLTVANRVRAAQPRLAAQARDTSAPGVARAATRIREQARCSGYVSLDHWDPNDVDDPTMTPDQHTRAAAPRGKHVWAEDVIELAHQGVTWPEVTRRLGVSHPTISKCLERGGRLDVVARITRNGLRTD